MSAENTYHLDPGHDFAEFGAYTTAFLNAIKLALPNAYHGGIIFSETTPAVVGEPSGYPTDWYEWHKRCVWLKPSEGSLLVYNAGWVSIFDAIPDGTITTDMLAAASVTLAKLAVGAGTALQLIRINAAGNGYEFVNPNSIVTALNVSALVGAPTGYKLLTSTSSAVAWETLDSALLLSLLGDNQIPISYLAYGTANRVLSTNSAGNGIEWADVRDKIAAASFQISKLNPESGNALKVLRVKADGSAFEFATISTPTAPNSQVSSDEFPTLPAQGSALTQAHSIGTLPSVVHGNLINVTTDAGYSQYDVISLGAVKCDSGAGSEDFSEMYQFSYNYTDVTLTRVNSGSPLLAHKTTGVVGTFTPANWKFKYTAIRYY